MHVRARLGAVLTALVVVAPLLLGVLWLRDEDPPSTTTIALPSIWVTDDELAVTANITLAGNRIRSFATPRGGTSSIAVDPVDGSLWSVGEEWFRAPRVVNYDVSGRILGDIPVSTFDGYGAEGVTVASSDGTLWVVDDPDRDGRVPTLYTIDRTGRLLASTPTSAFWPGTESPQDVAHDPYDGTLWITDNAVDRVINVTTAGELVASFSTQQGPFITADRPDGIRNPQAVAVVSPDELLLSSRYTGELLRISKSGARIVQSLPATVVHERAVAVTGAAVAPTTAVGTTRDGLLVAHDTLVAEGAAGGSAAMTGVVDDLRRALDATTAWTDEGEPDDGALVFGAIVAALERPVDVGADVDGWAARTRQALADVARHAAARRVAAAGTRPAPPREAVDAIERGDAARAVDELVAAVEAFETAWVAATPGVRP